jgi:hypothetical protein
LAGVFIGLAAACGFIINILKTVELRIGFFAKPN